MSLEATIGIIGGILAILGVIVAAIKTIITPIMTYKKKIEELQLGLAKCQESILALDVKLTEMLAKMTLADANITKIFEDLDSKTTNLSIYESEINTSKEELLVFGKAIVTIVRISRQINELPPAELTALQTLYDDVTQVMYKNSHNLNTLAQFMQHKQRQ
jgi:leucyl aminopeptidase